MGRWVQIHIQALLYPLTTVQAKQLWEVAPSSPSVHCTPLEEQAEGPWTRWSPGSNFSSFFLMDVFLISLQELQHYRCLPSLSHSIWPHPPQAVQDWRKHRPEKYLCPKLWPIIPKHAQLVSLDPAKVEKWVVLHAEPMRA